MWVVLMSFMSVLLSIRLFLALSVSNFDILFVYLDFSLSLSKIQSLLDEYELPNDLTVITNHSSTQWSVKVKTAIEKKNKKRLIQSCYKNENGIQTPKTKTSTIIEKIENENYKRGPEKEILGMTKKELKTVMIARYGMLECGKNYKGTMKPQCDTCNQVDDENHRLNSCRKWKDKNLFETDTQVVFDNIYSSDLHTIRNLLPHIDLLWNTVNAHGTIRE